MHVYFIDIKKVFQLQTEVTYGKCYITEEYSNTIKSVTDYTVKLKTMKDTLTMFERTKGVREGEGVQYFSLCSRVKI